MLVLATQIMVEVEFKPVTKVVVHEAIKYSFDEFLRMKAQSAPNGAPPMPVRWSNGIVFVYSSMQPTPEMVNERVRDGAVHWDFIEFAEMGNYQSVITHPDTQIQLRVIDNSNNSAIADVIRFFKNDPRFSTNSGV